MPKSGKAPELAPGRVVAFGKMPEKMAPQVELILKALKDLGATTEPELFAELERRKFPTRQGVQKVFRFYRARLISSGAIKTATK